MSTAIVAEHPSEPNPNPTAGSSSSFLTTSSATDTATNIREPTRSPNHNGVTIANSNSGIPRAPSRPSRPESADSEEVLARHYRRKHEFTCSRQKVARHRTVDDCWIIIDGRIFNVTAFMKDHPGGEAILLTYAGRDATREFETHHKHSTRAMELMEKYHIADLDTSSAEPANGTCLIS